jgi:hypothetical protein
MGRDAIGSIPAFHTYGPVAQGIEQLPSKQSVERSNRSRITKEINVTTFFKCLSSL